MLMMKMQNGVSPEDVVESDRVLEKAHENSIILRLVGGLAIRQHCSEIAFCDRTYADIDLVGLSRQAPQIIDLLTDLGYVENRNMTYATGGTRLLFEKPNSKDHIDVFLDQVNIEHLIDMKERLTIEHSTVSASDLLLLKLTISRLNEKDFRDIFTLLKDLAIAQDDTAGAINLRYIAKICSEKWGVFQDISTNIDRCLTFMKHYDFQPDQQRKIQDTLQELKREIESHPKSLLWKLRSRIGTRISWRRKIELDGVRLAPDHQDGGPVEI